MIKTRNDVVGVISIALFILGWVLFITLDDTTVVGTVAWITCFAGFLFGMLKAINGAGNRILWGPDKGLTRAEAKAKRK